MAGPLFIASSKSAHRVSALCKQKLGIDLPEDDPRLYSSLLPPNDKKAEALRDICRKVGPQATVHFVDDRYAPARGVCGYGRLSGPAATRMSLPPIRLETLSHVAAQEHDADLASVQLYLASWGYCTPQEIGEANSWPGGRIQLLDLDSFHDLLGGRGLSSRMGSLAPGQPMSSADS